MNQLSHQLKIVIKLINQLLILLRLLQKILVEIEFSPTSPHG